MNTYQLQCAIVSDIDLHRSFLGVFSSDELSHVHLLPEMGVIANTDVTGLPGRHWVAFFCKRKNILEVYDSFGMVDWWKKESLLKFQSPTSIFIVGPSNSGKTMNTKKLPENADDDLMMESADSKKLIHLLTVGIHHNSITLIQILHNLYCKGKAMRTASLNCHYFILFRNYRDQLQIQTLRKQIFPGQSKYLLDAYKKATSAAYCPLLIDLNPHTDKTYQLTTDRGVGQTPIVYHSAE
ncbi:unnamed protein product [Mytilus coruscus]|uniref:Uncharacterized protein n=1 Tax=Mytilus coruscus TaxID=42192 RepID=A0A6J8F474_MYTCO|nr:unnamed protein product [Mytilus coruscus]